MIPKIIHYCWFGHKKKPRIAKKCIKSWKKHLPDYQIIEWNEDNYDIASAPAFVQQAFEAKKWAFATDYIRYQVVYEYGGIYFDTDVEILKNIDSFRKDKAFFGIQGEKAIASGLGFGAEKGTAILLDLMNNYRNIPFLLPDGTFDVTPCPQRDAQVFIKHGYQQDGREQIIKGGIHIYPSEYFCPYSWYGGKIKKTENTVAIHWFAASWFTKEQKKEKRGILRKERWYHFNHCSKLFLKTFMGEKKYERLKTVIKGNHLE